LRIAKYLLLSIAASVAALALFAVWAPGATLYALAGRGTHTLTEGVAYGTLPRHRLDVYRPVGAAPAGGWPVVVFFYGGSWTRGERAHYRFVGEALASRGILALVPDYRLYPEVRYPDFLNDCALALAHGLREAAPLGGNPKRVFVMGHSAGAYNAGMMALDPRWLRSAGHSPHELAGWIGLAGPYDFLPIENADAQPVFFHPNYPLGSQPVGYVRRDAPRGLLAGALDDELVNPQRNTVGLATLLQQAGAPVTLKLYENVNHTTLVVALARPLRWLAPVLDDVGDFVTR